MQALNLTAFRRAIRLKDLNFNQPRRGGGGGGGNCYRHVIVTGVIFKPLGSIKIGGG